VVLMGDHGGGQPNVYADVARKLTEKYAAQGITVHYCDAVYATANDDFGTYLETIGLPAGGHGSISDTSIMLYLGGADWVRLDELPKAEGDPILPRGARPVGAAQGQWHQRRCPQGERRPGEARLRPEGGLRDCPDSGDDPPVDGRRGAVGGSRAVTPLLFGAAP
jgi:hypothetical protein